MIGTLSARAEGDSVKEGMIEEIIVTATYRDTNSMDTPMSVSAVTAEMVEDLGAQSMEDLFTMVPGLNMVGSTNGQSRYTIRGITSQSGYTSAAPMGATVGVYLDGTPVKRHWVIVRRRITMFNDALGETRGE